MLHYLLVSLDSFAYLFYISSCVSVCQVSVSLLGLHSVHFGTEVNVLIFRQLLSGVVMSCCGVGIL